jgi:hypothetical protein
VGAVPLPHVHPVESAKAVGSARCAYRRLVSARYQEGDARRARMLNGAASARSRFYRKAARPPGFVCSPRLLRFARKVNKILFVPATRAQRAPSFVNTSVATGASVKATSVVAKAATSGMVPCLKAGTMSCSVAVTLPNEPSPRSGVPNSGSGSIGLLTANEDNPITQDR